jgi:hypothetical protein
MQVWLFYSFIHTIGISRRVYSCCFRYFFYVFVPVSLLLQAIEYWTHVMALVPTGDPIGNPIRR